MSKIIVNSIYLSAQKPIQIANNLITQAPGQIDVKLSKHADNIEDNAYTRAPKRTGRMASNTRKRKYKGNNGIGYEVVGTEDYTAAVHNGTFRMPARPYLKEAFDKELPSILKFTATDIGLSASAAGGANANKRNFSGGWV